MTTRKDQEMDWVVRKIYKTSDELKDGGMPQWRAVANLNLLEMAERDSTSLERRSAESSGIMVSEANTIYLDRVMETVTDMWENDRLHG